MQTAFATYGSSQVHYCWFGTGNKILLCLHGYGESEQTFHFLESHIPPDYTVLAIDMPFHGSTHWEHGLQFTATDLQTIINNICHAIGKTNARFTMLGYSMGGRIALQLLEVMPDRVDKVVLLAPDGLKVNIWYWFATHTYMGKKLFSYTMEHPGWLFWVLQTASKFKLVNQSILKFTRYYIHDTRVRRQLYERWICMRFFRPRLAWIKKLIHTRRIPVRLLYGQYDRIIRYERGQKFRRGIESFCTLQLIQAGHQVLQEKYVNQIVHLIKD
jgi:pimeloyl-ACP methyl ester carboxylesterase